MVSITAVLLVISPLYAVTSSFKFTTSQLKVSIFYEALCPDSINFMKTQLQPQFDGLKDRIVVDFVPYGKATQNIDSFGTWSFVCQHGIDECKGNKYQACALDQHRGQDSDVKFVICVMTSEHPSDDIIIKNCANKNGYDWSTISECYGGNRGSKLLAQYGDRTHNLNPKFIPSVVYNDKFNQALQNQSLNDFLHAACSQLSDPKPDVCKE